MCIAEDGRTEKRRFDSSGTRNEVCAAHGTASAVKPLVSLWQQSREQRRPSSLTLLVGDHVLADFDSRMGQTAAFAVHRYRVIRDVGDGVGLVIADDEVLSA